MRNILFIHPRLGYMDTQRDAPAPPLGILSAVTLLRNKYKVFILDQRLFSSDKEFYKKLSNYFKNDLLYVGFSVYTGIMINYALEISEFIKENTNIPIVWGGIHPTILPEQTLANKSIDFVIQGEGEETLLEFSEELSKDNPALSKIKGVWSKISGEIASGGPRELLDLETLPPLPYELINLSRYIQTYSGKKYIYYQVSRGCPRKCGYCYNQSFNKGIFRTQSINKTVKEIQALRQKYTFDGIYFVDDNIFAIGKEFIIELGKRLHQLGLCWFVQGSDIVALREYTAEDFKLLETYGLSRLSIGIESASQKMRTLIGKPGSIEHVRQIMTALSKTNIRIYSSYIINFPEETIADLRESIKLIFELQKINKNVLNSPFYMYTPFPGTVMYDKYRNILPVPNTLEGWGRLGYESSYSIVLTKYLKDRHFFQSLFLTSLLDDDKVLDFSTNKILIILSWLYRPFAQWRLKKLFFQINIELLLFKFLFPNIFNK